jgi:hypothetical protein
MRVGFGTRRTHRGKGVGVAGKHLRGQPAGVASKGASCRALIQNLAQVEVGHLRLASTQAVLWQGIAARKPAVAHCQL